MILYNFFPLNYWLLIYCASFHERKGAERAQKRKENMCKMWRNQLRKKNFIEINAFR